MSVAGGTSPTERSAGDALLRPEVVARLGALHLKARQVVEGVLSGLHKSPHHGQSIEFAEHKEYAPGDEIRHIDWKAYGKFDKYYVKQYEQETNLRAFLLLDASKSMAYAYDGVEKLEYARVLSASLAYLLVNQSDAVGTVVYGGGVREYLPARSSAAHLHEVLGCLERAQGEGETALPKAVDFLSERARRRAMVIVFTDLLDPDEASLSAIRRLRARKHDVVVVHLLDRAELEFPFEDPSLFVGMEDDRRLQVDPLQIRESYREEVARFIDHARQSLREADVQYEQVVTDTPYDKALVGLLARRAAGGRR